LYLLVELTHLSLYYNHLCLILQFLHVSLDFWLSMTIPDLFWFPFP
jgi:hypothetical protein